MNDKEFFETHPKAGYSEFTMWTWHKKFHSETKNPNCEWCKE